MNRIVFTEDTFHAPMDPSKVLALMNIEFIFVTLATFHADKS